MNGIVHCNTHEMKTAFGDAEQAGPGKELKETEREKEVKVSGVGKHHEVFVPTT